MVSEEFVLLQRAVAGRYSVVEEIGRRVHAMVDVSEIDEG
jgi:hypothetical protein